MQPESISNVDKNKQIKYYVKGSGTSACLLTGKLDDEPQFIQFAVKDMEIIDIQLSGLFALALVKDKIQQNTNQAEKTNKNTNKLIKWGNLNQQLIHNPQIIQLKQFKQIKLINCGWNHALLRTEDGILLGMGENKYGQIGLHNGNKFVSGIVPVIQNQNQFVDVICAGFRQSYWRTSKNEMFGCGESKNNQLGKVIKKQVLPQTKLQMQLNFDSNIIKISCGKKFVIILTQKGDAFGLGTNDYKCLSTNETNSFDKFIKMGENLQDLQCGWSHVVFLDRQGYVRSRGRNNFGQLGRKIVSQESKVEIGQKCNHIKVGTQFNFAKGKSGKLYGWGWNEHMNITNKPEQTIIQTPQIIETPLGLQLQSCFTYPAITILKGVIQE